MKVWNSLESEDSFYSRFCFLCLIVEADVANNKCLYFTHVFQMYLHLETLHA